MGKKSVLLGLILLVVGGSLLGWALNDEHKDKQLQQQRQQERQAELSELARVIGNEFEVSDFEAYVYDENSAQEESNEYKQREEARGLILTIAGVLSLTGGAVVGWWLLLTAGRALIRAFRDAVQFLRGSSKPQTSAEEQEQSVEDEQEEDEPKPSAAAAPVKRRRSFRDVQEELKSHAGSGGGLKGIPGKLDKGSKVAAEAGRKDVTAGTVAKAIGAEAKKSKPGTGSKAKGSEQNLRGKGKKHNPAKVKAKGENMKCRPNVEGPVGTGEDIELLLSDAASERLGGPLSVQTKGADLATNTAVNGEDSRRLEDSFKAQTQELEKKMAEFKQMAQAVQAKQVAEQGRPIEDSIKDLTEQMSAIRDYAADQQERVKRLQDGYDWNIIRNFCLRVIRCIDNLESRIEKLSSKKASTRALEEIKDELVFALESTGVEQFAPQVNSEYRGQERNAEAVKEKQNCDDPSLTGKIAEVIRPGYQYFIDEDNVKIVRTAQVKLYH